MFGDIYASGGGLVRKLTPVPDGSFTLTTLPVGIVLSAQAGFDRVLSINLDGYGTANWTAIKSASSDWLTLSSTSGAGTAYINVDANPSGLHGGFYSGSITITSPQAVNGSVVVPVTLRLDYPSPTLTSVNPASAPIGSGATTVTLTGSNFVNSAKAQFGDTILETTFVDSTQLTAVIPAGNLTNVGTYTIMVFNPSPGGGTSSALFSVIDPNPKKRQGQITSQ
jgi:hypothetical protein